MQFGVMQICNLFEIWKKIINFSNQASARSEVQHLLYNQIKSTFI